jgi:hypothetical protein
MITTKPLTRSRDSGSAGRARRVLIAEESDATREFLAVIWSCREGVLDVVQPFRIDVIGGVICGASSASSASRR